MIMTANDLKNWRNRENRSENDREFGSIRSRPASTSVNAFSANASSRRACAHLPAPGRRGSVRRLDRAIPSRRTRGPCTHSVRTSKSSSGTGRFDRGGPDDRPERKSSTFRTPKESFRFQILSSRYLPTGYRPVVSRTDQNDGTHRAPGSAGISCWRTSLA